MKSSSDAIRARWKDFSKNWSRVRRSPTSSAVHELRSTGRRLEACIAVVAESAGISNARAARQLERILSRLGPLRDFHIFRRALARFEVGHDDERFCRYLDRQQSREKRRLGHRLKANVKRALRRRLDKVDRLFQKASDSWTYMEFRAAFENVLQQQCARLTVSHRAWAEQPDDKRFHGMRVELRGLRYATEFATEVLGTLDYPDIQTHLRVMRNLQTIMGDIHDLHKLRTSLVAWTGSPSAKRRPALMNLASQLQQKYESRMVEFKDHCRSFEGCLPTILSAKSSTKSQSKKSPIINPADS